jgi:Putative transposase
VACRPTFFLPVRVLSRLFRRLFLKMLTMAHADRRLAFFGEHVALTDMKAFAAFLAPLRKAEWVVYAKEPFGGPQAVLAYLSRYTHRVAISNRRLISADERGVTFRCKDYRIEGPGRYKTITLPTHEFIRRFLMHVLPKACIASVTMACSPMAIAPPTSHGRASCSPCHPASQSQRRTRHPRSISCVSCQRRARAAVAA